MIIKKIKVENFKNQNFDLNFQEGENYVYGANGTGKSSIYDAFYWCITGNMPSIASPIPQDNKLASISVELQVDNLNIKRVQKALLTKEKSLKGYNQEIFLDNIPLKAKEYQEKIKDIFNFDLKLLRLDYFVNLSSETKRNLLILVLKPNSEVKTDGIEELALELQKNSISDIEKKYKNLKKEKDNNNITIPSKIEQSKKLIVDKDFQKIEKEIKITEDKLNYQKSIQKKPQNLDRYKEINKKIIDCENIIIKNNFTIQKINDKTNLLKQEINTSKNQIEVLKNEYIKERDKKVEVTENLSFCPTCGQPLPQQQIDEIKKKLNIQKSNNLDKIVKNAEIFKEKILSLEKEINNSTDEREKIEEENQENTKKIDILKKELSKLNISSQDNTEEEIKKLENQLISLKLQKEIIEKIEKEIEDLEIKFKENIQNCANVEKILNQISIYKHRQIETFEKEINSNFELVRFRMFEKNLTNDEYKEICEPYTNGVDYSTQNTAMKIAMLIDIQKTFCKKLGIELPLFIDNRESISEIPQYPYQIINLIVDSNCKKLKCN